MNYWITTQWPPRVGDDDRGTGTGVSVPEGRQQAAEDMRSGDYVAVYEASSGPTEVRERPDGTTIKVACKPGRGGMICYGTADSVVTAIPDSRPKRYVDGRELWWRWYTRLSVLSRTGFVERPVLNKILGYKPGNPLRGFGDRRSGLKKIEKPVFDALVQAFHDSRMIDLPTNSGEDGHGRGGGGEGAVHLNLKSYVASNPASALNEPGLRLLRVEYTFPTNDRADIVLVDRHNRIVGVEIKALIGDNDMAGPLQAIKYRHMLECVTRRECGDSRGMLLAHEISTNVKDVCAEYGIECREISREAVDSWAAQPKPVTRPAPPVEEDRGGVRQRLISEGLLRPGSGNAATILNEALLVLPASLSEALTEERNDRL